MARRTDPATVIRSQVVLEEHDVAQDGRFAVVTRRFVQGDRYRSHLWLIPLGGNGRPIQLTSGRVRDTTPRIAPDGSSVAFKRSGVAPRAGSGASKARAAAVSETPTLFVLPIRPGGRPGRPWSIRTPKDRSVGELAWSPDARRLALTLDVDPPRFLVGRVRDGEEPVARRITRLDWRYDEIGHLDRWAHLHVIEAKRGARPKQVTAGDWGVEHLAWSPDGATIAFASDPRPTVDVDPRRSIWTVAVDAPFPATPTETLALGGDVHSPAWSPDGRWLAAVGYVAEGALDDTSPEVVVGPADGSTAPWPLDAELDRPIGNWVDSDLHGWTQTYRLAPAWVDHSAVVAIVSDRGMSSPWRYPIDPATGRPTGRSTRLTNEDVTGVSLAVAPRADASSDARVTLLGCLGDRPMELLTLPPGGGRARVRSRLGSRWADGLAWPEMRRIEVPGPGGAIDTWVASPAGAGAGPLPTVVNVHGGPLGAWTAAPSIEIVLLCAAGYRVLLPNIRGSTSYGRDWIRPQLNDWGGVDAADIHAATDHAVAIGLADSDRLGVMGLSYGGFMASWLVGTTNRFAAAMSEAGVTNQVSAWANGDTSVAFNLYAEMGAPLDQAGVDNLWRQSPLANVANVHTPLLMLQGEADRRCPAADNEQLFVALRVLGRPVEFVLYPEEGHVYQAAGRPDRRVDRMERMVAWFDRYLRGEG